MPRSRRSGSNAFSLFAFQDIITSVTAIMILIVLIMALEFVSRSRSAGVAEDHRAVAAELKTAIKDLEGTLSNLRGEVLEASRLADTAVGADAVELQRRYKEEEARDRASQLALGDATRRVAAAATEFREADTSESLRRLRQETSRLVAEAERCLAEVAATERECQEMAARAIDAGGSPPGVALAEMVFNAPPAGGKRPVLVEVTADGVAIAERPGGPSESLGWGLWGPPSALGQWLRGLDDAQESVLIVLRPSGLRRFDAVREAVLAAGLDVGTELVGETTQLRAAGANHP